MEKKTREAYLTLQEAINKKQPKPVKACNAMSKCAEMTRALQDIGVYLGCVK